MDTLTIDRPRDRAKRMRSATAEVKTVNLALQGGRWLTENFDRIGVESTIDVHERYL